MLSSEEMIRNLMINVCLKNNENIADIWGLFEVLHNMLASVRDSKMVLSLNRNITFPRVCLAPFNFYRAVSACREHRFCCLALGGAGDRTSNPVIHKLALLSFEEPEIKDTMKNYSSTASSVSIYPVWVNSLGEIWCIQISCLVCRGKDLCQQEGRWSTQV